MSDQRLRDALEKELRRQGVDEFHEVRGIADALARVTAAHPVEPARPLLDREAVRSLFRGPNACGYWLENLMDDHEQEAATDAVMELARPMPTQSELTEWLREIFTADPGGTPFGTAAEELLALLNGAES